MKAFKHFHHQLLETIQFLPVLIDPSVIAYKQTQVHYKRHNYHYQKTNNNNNNNKASKSRFEASHPIASEASEFSMEKQKKEDEET